MATGLTKKQSDALAFIRSYAAEHNGTTPSYEEIVGGLGLKSKSGVHRLVVALAERGHIVRLPGRARAIRITRAGEDESILLEVQAIARSALKNGGPSKADALRRILDMVTA